MITPLQIFDTWTAMLASNSCLMTPCTSSRLMVVNERKLGLRFKVNVHCFSCSVVCPWICTHYDINYACCLYLFQILLDQEIQYQLELWKEEIYVKQCIYIYVRIFFFSCQIWEKLIHWKFVSLFHLTWCVLVSFLLPQLFLCLLFMCNFYSFV